MAYTKKTWVTGETIQAVDLNHLESGVEAISANGAIGTTNISDGAVTNAKLAANAVTSAKIANNSITEDELAGGAVVTAKIEDGAVTSAKLADSAYHNTAATFDTSKAYSAGDYCINSGALYRFTADKAAGAWDSTKVVAVALADDVLSLGNEIDNADTVYETAFFASDFQQGVWGVGTGFYNSSITNYICSKGYILNESIIKVICPATHKMRVQAWDSADTYVGTWNGTSFVTENPNYYLNDFDLSSFRKLFPTYKFKICVCNQDGTSAVTVDVGASIVYESSFGKEQKKFNATLSDLQNFSSFMEWEIGSIFGNSGVDYDENVRTIRTPNAKRIYLENDVVFECNNNNVVMMYAFKYNHTSGEFIERIGSGNRDALNLEKGYDYRLAVFAPSNTTITEETIPTYSARTTLMCAGYSDIYAIVNKTGNYSIDSAFGKTNRRLNLLGSMLYGQSFCIYNDKVYSTDGSHIGVQDLSTFTQISTTSVSCGHGNAFQLGTANLAYISGWDDNKVYVIDLDTVTLSDTISLPTTNGYTTCAVDDVNKLIYIFHLSTAPATGGYYDFIVYDYDNEQIISTKKIPMWIRAMQGVDFVNSRIVVLSGLGASTNGNKYSIFNTNGDLIAKFVVGDMESEEPEGIFVDRENDDVYISYMNQYKLYKLQ